MKRSCGDCTLCCKLLPVPTIGKPAGQRCKHQRHGKGCAIYSHKPRACEMWSCRWLLGGQHTEGLSRPDRVHYVIDPMPDYVKLTDNNTGSVRELPVIQVWLDAGHPDAHRDPGLRAYLEAEAKRTGMAALVRMPGNNDALGLFAPSISSDGQWHEVVTNFRPEFEHSRADIDRVMHDNGLGMKIEVEP